jgi:ABC-2 type transport system ATP-binding protein
MSRLKIEHLVKDYGKQRVLHGIELEIEPGMFGLLGPNGAGKTTLMRILTTLISPSAGRIQFGKISWEDVQQVRQIIGYLPQKFSLYAHIRVEEALHHLATLKGVPNRKKEVQSVLEKVNLLAQRNMKIGELSGGMIRRVGIAQAILGDPKIILVDEPTAGLDPEERIRFRKLLRYLGKEAIVIISTHIVEDIETTCHQVAILHKGSLMANGMMGEIATKADGKVWKASVTRTQFYRMADEYEVMASHQKEGGYEVRILSDIQPPDASLVPPTLEEGYLYLMKSRGGRDERKNQSPL